MAISNSVLCCIYNFITNRHLPTPSTCANPGLTALSTNMRKNVSEITTCYLKLLSIPEGNRVSMSLIYIRFFSKFFSFNFFFFFFLLVTRSDLTDHKRHIIDFYSQMYHGKIFVFYCNYHHCSTSVAGRKRSLHIVMHPFLKLKYLVPYQWSILKISPLCYTYTAHT